eukprot:351479-Chlamydomonas_euryale.AAC.32
MHLLHQAAVGRQVDTEVVEGCGRPPQKRCIRCIHAFRPCAAMAPGGDQMEATFLKAGLPIAQRLLRAVCYAWESALHPESGNLL